jgi:D-lactate dehydrogenase (cytochrome)
MRITVSGNGTGLTGARVPEGGVVISTEKMNKIIELNVVEKYLRVEPGMILKDLQDYVEEKNLFYPPDPTERNCFIGATVATNSSGARSFKYGPTRDYVIGMRVVLPTGQTISLERGKIFASAYNFSFSTDQGTKYNFSIPQFKMPKVKNAAGYYCSANMDLIDLFIGSEGTLGIITELKLKLLALEEKILSCVVFFQSEEDAFNFIDEARSITKSDSSSEEIKISARGMEFFNKLKWMLDLVERKSLEYVVYGHFGNCHTHLNMLPRDQADFIQAKKIYSEICCEAVRFRGIRSG